MPDKKIEEKKAIIAEVRPVPPPRRRSEWRGSALSIYAANVLTYPLVAGDALRQKKAAGAPAGKAAAGKAAEGQAGQEVKEVAVLQHVLDALMA
jgi:hypothetical protein